jgi:hypothetical protein
MVAIFCSCGVAKSSKTICTSDTIFLRGRTDGFGDKCKIDPGHCAMVKLMFPRIPIFDLRWMQEDIIIIIIIIIIRLFLVAYYYYYYYHFSTAGP